MSLLAEICKVLGSDPDRMRETLLADIDRLLFEFEGGSRHDAKLMGLPESRMPQFQSEIRRALNLVKRARYWAENMQDEDDWEGYTYPTRGIGADSFRGPFLRGPGALTAYAWELSQRAKMLPREIRDDLAAAVKAAFRVVATTAREEEFKDYEMKEWDLDVEDSW